MTNKNLFNLCLTLSLFFAAGIPDSANAQNNVIIIVMDGAGWAHTFGAGNSYIPRLYNDMRPLGTLYTNFRIDYNAGGQTLSNPGHATIATGTWQNILNNGTQRPTLPTIFEYYRKHFSANQNTCYVIAGKNKLNILTYSDDADYGETFGASWLGGDLNDQATYNNVVLVMSTIKPNLLIVNFADVDHAGDSGNLTSYTDAITTADNYIYQIWQHIQNGDYGYNINNTTLFKLMITDETKLLSLNMEMDVKAALTLCYWHWVEMLFLKKSLLPHISVTLHQPLVICWNSQLHLQMG